MYRRDFLICYDISDKKRLSKIAKLLESRAIRVQKSLFYIKMDKEELKELSNLILDIINESEDDVRIYQANLKNSIELEAGLNISYPTILI